ncbi:hypothetical protein VPH35_129479 [Triticum aestivum]
MTADPSTYPPATEPMKTEVAGKEGARGDTDDAVATEGEADTDDPAGEEAAKAAAAEAGEGSGIALTAPRSQERQALRRPPIPPPLLQSQAPKSPSPVPT